jgi:predicted nucleic acid-binding protein
MKILLDTNVVLDLLLERDNFFQQAKEIFEKIENRKIDGFLCATTITTIHYLVSKAYDKNKSDEIIKELLKLFEIVDVNKSILLKAIANNGTDFEDSVIYSGAECFDIDIIITRDKKGFKNSNIQVLNPNEFLIKEK